MKIESPIPQIGLFFISIFNLCHNFITLGYSPIINPLFMSNSMYLGVVFILLLSLFNPISKPNTIQSEAIGKFDCEAFYKLAMDEMLADQNQFVDEFLKNKQENYSRDYDFEKNTLKIKNKENGKIVAKIAFIHVGHFDAKNNLWHWAWKDYSMDSKYADHYQQIKKYGMEHGCDKLTVQQWAGKEVNAWEMSGAVNHILKGKGAARHYTQSEYNYVVFMEIEPVVD